MAKILLLSPINNVFSSRGFFKGEQSGKSANLNINFALTFVSAFAQKMIFFPHPMGSDFLG